MARWAPLCHLPVRTSQAVWWLVLTWTDFNAGRVVQASTAATEGVAATSSSTNCSRYCDSGGLASMGCCDGIWLPHIELLNILQYFDDQLPRYRINANPSTGIVTWSTRLVGKWYDMSSTAPLSNASGSASGKGTNQQVADYQAIAVHDRYFSNNTARGTTKPPHCGFFKKYDESRALYGPAVLIKRVSSYYVLTNLIPILLITLVAFVVFFMPQNELGDRMGVVLTMFLSLTAMQFVFDFPPANYINALQMVVLVSYIMIALACIESLIVNRIATVSEFLGTKRTCVRKYDTLLARYGADKRAKVNRRERVLLK
ncbi:hypothetical protein VOLCADRAFT_91876 [Volvox carteri f. nagariensis]|uniref:Neurotransmitter-gated ion-channel transmembrane domain-containing protein n=1 Tax=Volvox carteri f. nagariensis TaxID=3068 RepID=D8TY68_VOLCA|nr:uncharacterized protein VOLCADRAFT_91876 [Volvox carteri f. nagariensis]EFJ47497.1 hypothetical protein VOLCADRAFT_91876 [Volvox carteri f. nagariensis]|eukprot:XP_002951321.1 hypothetical protein VOLCADRAFT_91876 [Volvox carteri f. nagariensis]